MAAAYKSWPLNKVTDAAHWDAEDLFSRLCIVGDAAFLSSGFLPCDVPETTPWSVSSRYSVPQLAHREGADAAVLCISRRGAVVEAAAAARSLSTPTSIATNAI